mgnify:CR=1 FL=1
MDSELLRYGAMKRTICMAALAAALLIGGRAEAFTASGFQGPYGVVVDPKTGFIYVSNVNGQPAGRDDNGFISRLKGDGTVDQLRFIDGASPDISLHAPKGMAIRENLLYVADIDKLQAFDLGSGRHLFDVNFGDLPVQHFYGVFHAPDDSLYLSDGPASTVWRIDVPRMHEVTTFASGPELGQPHGVTWCPARQLFMIAGWSSGQVLAFDRTGKRQPLPSISVRTLEGIAADDSGNLYLTSSQLSGVYRVSANFVLFSFALGQAAPAGVAFNAATGEIVFANFDGNTVLSYPVPAKQ